MFASIILRRYIKVIRRKGVKMSFIDWLIVLVPVACVIGFGWYTRRFVVGVSDFLVAGRVCNRYVITTGNLANALGLGRYHFTAPDLASDMLFE